MLVVGATENGSLAIDNQHGMRKQWGESQDHFMSTRTRKILCAELGGTLHVESVKFVFPTNV